MRSPPNESPTPSCESGWRRLDRKLDQLGWHSTKQMLTLDRIQSRLESIIIERSIQTSMPSAVIPPTAPLAPKKAGRLRHIAQYGKPIRSFILEKALPWVWGLLAPILLGLYAWGREGAQLVWGWILGTWLWLIG